MLYLSICSTSHSMASDNCAIGSNGKLLNVSRIIWYNDANDDEPIVPVMTSSTAQHQVSAMMLNSFVTKVPPPCQSTHTPHSSAKIIDPDNVVALKRKPSNTMSAKPSCCPCYISPNHEADEATEATEPDPTDTEGNDPIDAYAAYEETKALSDADQEVSAHYSPTVPQVYLTLCKGHGHEV